MKEFTLSQLAEGVQRRSLGAEAPRLSKKWGETGLLEGLRGTHKDGMARLLENQAAELLRESNALSTGGAGLVSSGKIAGFTNVAFPIVRRVFAGLIANEIVSVQPMSLPTGLLFYLDYTYGSSVGGDAGTAANKFSSTSVVDPSTYTSQDSVYNNPRGVGVRSGSLATGGQYDLVGSGYSKVHKQSLTLDTHPDSIGSYLSGSTWQALLTVKNANDFVGFNARHVMYDAHVEVDVDEGTLDYVFVHISASEITANINGADLTNIEQIALQGFGSATNSATAWGEKYQGGRGILNLRSMNRRGNFDPNGTFTPDALNGSHVLFVVRVAEAGTSPDVGETAGTQASGSAAISDALSVNSDGSSLTIPSFESDFEVDSSPRIPEVDIRIESTSVTAVTRKLRARWSPEMAQDLTAFYSIDVEVELTNILSEMITLDIDREILNDLLTQGNAANFFWSRAPGKLVNKFTGNEATMNSTLSPGPMAFVNIQEWYQTLLETITDVANSIHRKTLRGSGNFIVTSPDVATILEHLVAYKPSYNVDGDGQVQDNMTVGAEAVGSLNNRYTVYKDPYFPSNKLLIGLKGNTFLESGYIYAPYVPLILTPVIYAQEDFTPRKGVMTRYGKKMVRSDFYGTVTVLDMNII